MRAAYLDDITSEELLYAIDPDNKESVWDLAEDFYEQTDTWAKGFHLGQGFSPGPRVFTWAKGFAKGATEIWNEVKDEI